MGVVVSSAMHVPPEICAADPKLTLDEAAKYLRISRRTLNRRIRDGAFKVIAQSQQCKHVRKSELDAYVSRMEVQGKSTEKIKEAARKKARNGSGRFVNGVTR